MKTIFTIVAAAIIATNLQAEERSAYNKDRMHTAATNQEILHGETNRNAEYQPMYAPVYETHQDLNRKMAAATSKDGSSATTTNPPPMKMEDDRTNSRTTGQTSYTEDQVAEIMNVVNEAEIDAAQMAKKRGSHAAVKDFANMMIDDHKKNNKDGRKLIRKLDVRTNASDTSRMIKDNTEEKLKELKKLKGHEFDHGYMAMQIDRHRSLVTDLDEKYIPAVGKPELKEFLKTTRTHVQHHLDKAQEIQRTLGTVNR